MVVIRDASGNIDVDVWSSGKLSSYNTESFIPDIEAGVEPVHLLSHKETIVAGNGSYNASIPEVRTRTVVGLDPYNKAASSDYTVELPHDCNRPSELEPCIIHYAYNAANQTTLKKTILSFRMFRPGSSEHPTRLKPEQPIEDWVKKRLKV